MHETNPTTGRTTATDCTKPTAVQSLRMLAFLCIVMVVLATQLFLFVREYAVNLLYFDQWDFLTPLFKNTGTWETFNWQHGPHRQGLGNVLARWIFNASRWDTVVEGYCISGLLVTAAITAILLKRRVVGHLKAYDAVIPLLCISLDQFETIIAIPNMSHSILPLLLLLLFCLTDSITRQIPRTVAMIVVSFFMVFTGFGILGGVMALLLFLLRAARSLRQGEISSLGRSGAAVLLIAGSFALFFGDFAFMAGVPDFVFPHSRPWEYLTVSLRIFGSFWGFRKGALSLGVGVVGAVLALYVWGRSVRELLRSNLSPKPYISTVFVLAGFSILFCAGVSVGRISLGDRAGTAHRYATLLIPAFLSLYFGILTTSRRRMRRVLLIAFVGMVLAKSTYFAYPFIPHTLKTAVTMHARKNAWISCYKRSKNLERAERISALKIHPAPDEAKLEGKLRYLEESRLNLFKGEED